MMGAAQRHRLVSDGGRWPRWSTALLVHELARHHLAWDIEDLTGPIPLSVEGSVVTVALAGPTATLPVWCDTLDDLATHWQERFRYRTNGQTLTADQVDDSIRTVAVAVTTSPELTLRVRLLFAGWRDCGPRGALPLRCAS